MKYALILVALVALSGCDRAAENIKAKATGTGDASALTKYIDREHGVICYAPENVAALSCVQVANGTKGDKL